VWPPQWGRGSRSSTTTGQLQVRGTFASTPHAQNVRTLVNEGHIKTTSVAFMERKTGKKDAKTERELLNGAFVAVPANAEAVVLASKSVAVEENALVAIIDRAVEGGDRRRVHHQQTSTPEGGSPQETAEESAAETAAPAAVEAAEESAESVALRARALAFLLKANTSKEFEE
jgi:hypothetical protein